MTLVSLFKTRIGRGKLAIGLVALLLAANLATGCISSAESSPSPTLSQAVPVNAITGAAPLYDEEALTALYELAAPAVVEVNVVEKQAGGSLPLQSRPQRGQGSGFLIDNDGHILTNYHVAGNASQIKVVLDDGRTLEAKLAGSVREDDLALLKVDPSKLNGITPLPLGDSDAAKPGQMAIAMGSPFGLQGSITVGVVSGKGRSLNGIANRTITDMIQTDASINFGNSGGPLLNSRGEVIGINTAIETSFSQATGIGYAIPINTAKSNLPSMMEGKEAHRPWLGIEALAITPDLAEELGLPVKKGVYIIAVAPKGPADTAGIEGSGTEGSGDPSKGGDIVTAVNGQSISKVEDIVKYLNSKKPGDTVTLSVIREGKNIAVEVTLAEWPKDLSSEPEVAPLPRNFDPFRHP